jgi:hypothetical protein
MSLLLKSLSGLETIAQGDLLSSQRVTLITAGGFKNVTWGSMLNAISDPLNARMDTLEDAIEGIVSESGSGPSIWPIARTITLTGAVAGSVSMDGSTNVSMATTIADGSLSLAKVSGLSTRLDTLDTQVTKFWGTGFTAGTQPSAFTGNADLITGATFLSAVYGTATNIPNEAGGNFALITNGPTNTGQQLALRNGEGWIRGQVTGVWGGWNKLWTSANLDPSNLLLKTDVATSATKLATARGFSLTGVVAAASVNFDGTGNVALATTIADAALSIAKTSGLQAALDAKWNDGGLIGAVSLNTIQTSGWYRQDVSANATTANQYPEVNGQGILRVYKSGSYIFQEYRTITNASFRRFNNGSTWSAWTKVLAAVDFDPNTKFDKVGGAISGAISVAGAVTATGDVTGTAFVSTVAIPAGGAWLLSNSTFGGRQAGIRQMQTYVALANHDTASVNDYELRLFNDGSKVTFGANTIYHTGNFDPINPVAAGGLLHIGDPGAAHLSLRNDGTYSLDGSTWRSFNESPAINPNPAYTSVTIGADSDMKLYEDSANALTVRAGASGAFKYFTFAANGNFLVPDGRVMIAGNEAWHAGNFDPTTKLGVSATAAAATKLATARTINGTAFDGTANITIPMSLGNDPVLTGTLLVDVNGVSTAKARITAGDGVAANGVHIDAINDTGSTFTPLNLRGSTVTLNGYTAWTNNTFNPATKLDARGSLGVAASLITDWNTAVDNGWYMGAGAVNAPAGLGSWLMVRVTQHNSAWVQQEGYVFTDGPSSIIYRRRMLNGTWTAWTTTQSTGAIYAAADGLGSTIYADMPVNAQGGAYALTWGATRQYQIGIEATGEFKIWTYTAAGAFQSTGFVMDRAGRVALGGATVGSDAFNAFKVLGGVKSFGSSALMAFEERDNPGQEWALYATNGLLRINRSGVGDVGTITSDGKLAISRVAAGWDAGAPGSVSCSNWFRTTGQTGIYFSDYAGGWYMTDTTYVRSYNNKAVAAGNFVISSDSRLKEHVRDFEYRGRLRPVNFSMIEGGAPDFGFIADEVMDQYPEATDWIAKQGGLLDGEMVRQLATHKLVAVVSYQVNRAEDRLDAVEIRTTGNADRTTALEARNEELETRLSTLDSELQHLKQLVADLTRSQ